MSLEKGFLRRPELILTKFDKFWVVVIYLVASCATHLLFTLCFESFHIVYNTGKWFEYKSLNETYHFYSWFIAGLSACTGLSFSLQFILRSKLNSLSMKKRFNTRLSYHFLGLNFWSSMSFISRIGHIFTFFYIIFFTENFYTMKSIYAKVMILALVVFFLNNWLMAHRILRKDYFKYVLGSFLVVCITTWGLTHLKSLNFTYYNQYVSLRSIHAKEHFDFVEGLSVQRKQDLYGPQLFMRPKPDSSLPEVTHSSWRGTKVLSTKSEAGSISLERGNHFQLIIDKKVRIEQVLNFQKLYQDKPEITFQYMALPKQDSISQAYFEHYRYTIWQSNNPGYSENPDGLENMLKGKKSIVINAHNGQYMIDSVVVSVKQLTEKITTFYSRHEHKAVVLLQTDKNLAFGEYINLLDQVKMSIINLQKAYVLDKYGYNFIHYLRDEHQWSHKAELADARTKYPLQIYTITGKD